MPQPLARGHSPAHQPAARAPLPCEQVGVQPDRVCAPLGGVSPAAAASMMSGIPVGPGASDLVIEELETDGGSWLSRRLGVGSAQVAGWATARLHEGASTPTLHPPRPDAAASCAALPSLLSSDCVLTAEALLQRKVESATPYKRAPPLVTASRLLN